MRLLEKEIKRSFEMVSSWIFDQLAFQPQTNKNSKLIDNSNNLVNLLLANKSIKSPNF